MSDETPEQRKQVKGAAIGGLSGLLVVGVIVAVLGSPLVAVLLLIGSAVLLVLLYTGRLES